MKVHEILTELEQLIAPSEFDKKGTPMKYPNYYRYKNAGTKKKITAKTVIVKDSKTGKVYGRRTIYSKT